MITDDLSPFYNNLFHELRDKAGPRGVWSTGGQLFVKIGGGVRRVDARNKEEVLRELSRAARGADSSASPSQLRGFGRGRVRGGVSSPQ